MVNYEMNPKTLSILSNTDFLVETVQLPYEANIFLVKKKKIASDLTTSKQHMELKTQSSK